MNRITHILLALMLFVFSQAPWAETVNINTATAEQLDTLTGIGKAKAQAIIDDRTKNGPFKSIDDLARVKGIGPATVEKNRANIAVGTEPGAAEKPDASAKPVAKEK
ncbi:MAG: ComEA family DNA-binding protein [Methylococcales bacterium]